jgi:hypothetical protein
MLGKKNVKELRQTLAHLSAPAVRDLCQHSFCHDGVVARRVGDAPDRIISPAVGVLRHL